MNSDIPEIDMSFIDAGFYSRLPLYAFEQYLKKGIGAYFFTETADMNRNEDIIEDFIEYVPLNEKTAHTFPVKALRMLSNYDPCKELIFITESKDGTIDVCRLGRNVLPITPIEAYRRFNKNSGKGRFIPGELLSLKKGIDDIPKGHYLFLGRRGANMELATISDGYVLKQKKGSTTVKVHSDFEEMFKSRGWIGRLSEGKK
jgi:hypothetical protein